MSHLTLFANASAAATLTSLPLELSENETKRPAHSSPGLYRLEIETIIGVSEEQVTVKSAKTDRPLYYRDDPTTDHVFPGWGDKSAVGIVDISMFGRPYLGWGSVPPEPLGLRRDIQETLDRILVESQGGNLRGAYREVFSLLNAQFAKADYALASVILRVICSMPYPSTVGIGALRFSSSVSSRISAWKTLVRAVRARLGADGLLAEEDLRGLE